MGLYENLNCHFTCETETFSHMKYLNTLVKWHVEFLGKGGPNFFILPQTHISLWAGLFIRMVQESN